MGDKISAIGAPLGLEGSITSGIVSFTERKLFTTGSVFQIDAPVNSGNSGGPCIDTNMKVQAIVFAGILDSQGLNFAIPVEFLKQEFNHCWIGCYGRTKKTGKKKTGLEILYVMPGSTSRFCGLSEGDIIYKVNDVSINSIEDMQSFLRECQPGTISKIFYRNEKSDVNEKLVYLEKRPEKPAVEVYNSDLVENSFLPLFGMKLSSVSEFKKRFVVSGIIPASQADELSFSENDTLYIKDIVFDKENKFILAQIVTQRHKKSIIDVVMVLSASYDNP